MRFLFIKNLTPKIAGPGAVFLHGVVILKKRKYVRGDLKSCLCISMEKERKSFECFILGPSILVL